MKGTADGDRRKCATWPRLRARRRTLVRQAAAVRLVARRTGLDAPIVELIAAWGGAAGVVRAATEWRHAGKWLRAVIVAAEAAEGSHARQWFRTIVVAAEAAVGCDAGQRLRTIIIRATAAWGVQRDAGPKPPTAGRLAGHGGAAEAEANQQDCSGDERFHILAPARALAVLNVGCHAHGPAWAWVWSSCPRKAVGMAPSRRRFVIKVGGCQGWCSGAAPGSAVAVAN